MRMRPRAEPLVRDASTLEGLLAVAFGQRRKMLRGTLLPWLRSQGVDPEALGIEPTARPEQVPVVQWARIADVLFDARRGQPPDGAP
jgi:16S rRNA (adenine1518-N6/adenine1519-N6)-dimethyltransferase